MSWFGGSDPAADLDAKIEEATSESIPNGDLDMATAMEITDVIRSKKVPPKQAMRCLKKRLTKVYNNPNILESTLKLCDICVKNGGSHFLVEINSKEFVDYLVDFIFKVHYDVKNYKVYSSEAKYGIGCQILRLVKEWSMYFQNKYLGNHLEKVYASLEKQGYEFPDVDLSNKAGNFIDLETPPDWIDGRECMICYNPFSVMNRKHHCRACGGVFCQTHSGNDIPLVSLGIMQPVRVCDDCFQIHKGSADKQPEPTRSKGITQVVSDEDEQLRKAIELSLQDSSVPYTRPSEPSASYTRPASPPPAADDEGLDDEMRAAIAASLAEYKATENRRSSYQASESKPAYQPPAETAANHPFLKLQPEPELDFYQNMMPDVGGYPASNPFQDQQQPEQQRYYSQQGSQQQIQQQPQTQQMQSQNTSQNLTFQQPGSMQNNQNTRPEPRQNYQAEDLTSVEEDDINLFVQLVNQIKNDPSKQANILYDQNLSDLHGKVVRLKPKLNKALRSSIEKYEFFLEMNNKLNSITRLYDQFLEAKLDQAYNRHTISSPSYYNQPPQYNEPQGQYFEPRRQGVVAQHTGHVSAQATGPQYAATQENVPSYSSAQIGHPPQESVAHAGPSPQRTGPQRAGQQRAGLRSRSSSHHFPEAAPALYPGSAQATGNGYAAHQSPYPEPVAYPEQIPYPVEPESQNREEPSYASAGQGQDGYDNTSQSQAYSNGYENTDGYGNDAGYGYADDEADSASQANFEPTFPQVPSSPPGGSDVSDAESVSSRYPAIENKYEEPSTQDSHVEHASTRYPTLERFEDSGFESMLLLKRLTTNESKKYKSEPEPLIEL